MAYRSSTALTGLSTTSAVVSKPAGAAALDICVIHLYIESAATITVPGAFVSKVDLNTAPTTQGREVVYWARLDGLEGATFTFSWTGAAFRQATCALFSGRVTSGDPFTDFQGAQAAGVGATTPAVVVTAATGDDLVFCAQNFDGGTWASYTSPLLERQDSTDVALATADAVSAGSTGNVTAVCTGGASAIGKAFLGAIAVASAAPGSTPGPLVVPGLAAIQASNF